MSKINAGGPDRRDGVGNRRSRNTFTTKSGQTIKVHRNLGERISARRDAAARRKAARLAGLPKSRFKRFLYHFHPKRMYHYWFSREGAIMALKITGIGIIAGFLLMVGVFAYFRKDLPNLKDISGSNLGGSIRYYDRTGQTLLWEDYDATKRTPVKDEDISQYLKDATVAIEDKDFFKHGGFDTKGIARAAINDVAGKGGRQGGSTITQQLIKLNYNWTKDQTITRKVKELILSVELERSYSKKEILAGYLNAAPYGNVQYGAETAAQDYFHKSAKDLTLDEAAFLAAIPKSPSLYSPYGAYYKQNPEEGKAEVEGRQDYILDQMLNQGLITKQQRDDAKKVDTLAKVQTPKPKYDNMLAPYFVLTAKEQLETKYGEQTVQRGGWKVTTTLDLNAQKIAEDQVQKGLAQVKRQGGDQIAFASEDVKTGQMVALVGGVDFNNVNYGKLNYARTLLPPGSSIKPYDYATFIDNNNAGAGSVLYDILHNGQGQGKNKIDGYPCTTGPSRTGNCAIDYDLRFPGPLTIRYALGGSRNIPAMKAMLGSDADPKTSVNKTIAQMKKLMQSPGTTEGEKRGNYKCFGDEEQKVEIQCGTASAIGDGAYLRLDEHVHGYATLSRNGVNIPQTYILKIQDAANKTVDEWKPSKGVQAIRAESAYIIDDILSDPKASYLGSKPHSYKGWKFGFKTGTTNDSKDGWMMGMSTQYTAGVWVGYHDRTREMTGFMENMTQPIMQGYMRAVHDNLKPEERVKPSGIQSLPAFVVTTHVGVGSVEPSPSTDLFPSWYKAPSKAVASKGTIDTVSNKKATDCTPPRARKEMLSTNSNTFSVDKLVGEANSADTSQQDDVHKCDDARPEVYITAATKNSITVDIKAGTHPLSSDQFPGSISVVIDGQNIQSYPVSSEGTQTLTFTYNGSGNKAVSITAVDSVLYESQPATATIDFGDGGSIGGINFGASRTGSSSVKFSWNANGAYTVKYKKSGTGGAYATACSGNGGDCTATIATAPGITYTSYLELNGSKVSGDETFN